MKARLALALVAAAIVAIVIRLQLESGEERTRGEAPALVDEDVRTLSEPAELESPDANPVREPPGEREALAVESEEPDDSPDDTLGADDGFEVELNPFTFFARVVEAGTGEPLAGARARLEDHPASEAFADASGLLYVDAPHDLGPVRVEHEGYAYQLVDPKEEYASADRALVVRLVRSATLVVRVERLDGPVEGLAVRVHTDGFWMKPRGTTLSFTSVDDPVWRADLDAAGGATFAGLPPQTPLTVDVHEGGPRLKRLPEVRLDVGEERELLVRLGGGCRILGQALETDGAPAEGLELWLLAAGELVGVAGSRYFDTYESDDLAARAHADAEGRFVLEDVAPGKWFVGPAPGVDDGAGAAAPVAQLVEVADHDIEKRVELEVHRGLTIRGRVVGPDGENVSRAYVMDTWGRADCNSRDGNFTLGPLAPGEYKLRAIPGRRSGFARSEPVMARAGDEDVVIEVRRGGSISIVVRDAAGKRVAADVDLIPEDAGTAGFGMTSTSAKPDGSYEFEGLSAGIYHVRALDSFDNLGMLKGLVIDESSALEEQVIALSPGVRVSVRIETPDDKRRLVWHVLQDGTPIGFRGQSAIVVAPGPLTVELREYDPVRQESVLLETREAMAIAGEEVEVVFDLMEQR